MRLYLSLPLIFLKFWYLEAPAALIKFFFSLNRAFLQLFSLPLLIKTFFKPWKNEYREGLVGFSIGMGMFIKTLVIIVDVIFLLLILSLEAATIVGFIFLPVLTGLLLVI